MINHKIKWLNGKPRKLSFTYRIDRYQVDQEFGGVGVPRTFVPDAPEVGRRAVRASGVAHLSPGREEDAHIEGPPYRRLRLVQGADGGHVAFFCELGVSLFDRSINVGISKVSSVGI